MVLMQGACSTPQEQADFDFIQVEASQLKTSHRLPLVLNVGSDFTIYGEKDFVESHDDIPFKVSTATFRSVEGLIIILAEEQVNPEGTFTYDLPIDTLNGFPVFRRVGCFNLFEETDQDLQENAYLRFLKEKGFDFQQGLNMVQFILLNEEKSAEVVMSYAALYSECPQSADETILIANAKKVLGTFSMIE